MDSAERLQPPDRLWIWEKGVYRDENRRIWLSILPQQNSICHVLMRQKDIPVGQAVSPRQLGAFPLPPMWQLYPERKYKCTDSRYWRIVYHIQIEGTEEMLLELLED